MAQGTHKSYTGEEFLEIMEGIIDWKKSAMGYSKDENLFQTAFAEGAGTTADVYKRQDLRLKNTVRNMDLKWSLLMIRRMTLLYEK